MSTSTTTLPTTTSLRGRILEPAMLAGTLPEAAAAGAPIDRHRPPAAASLAHDQATRSGAPPSPLDGFRAGRMGPMSELVGLLDRALAGGDAEPIRAELVEHSGLPGARLNLRLVSAFAGDVGEVVRRPDVPVEALEALLDGWAALPEDQAPGDRPEVILPCAAVAAYGEVGAVRPDWWGDEVAKLRAAAGDGRWRVREVVALALQRLLDADWDRTAGALLGWARADDPLVVRAAAAAVAEPPLLRPEHRWRSAKRVQQAAVDRLRDYPAAARRTPAVRVLRQALGFTVSVVVAATGDFALLERMAASGDADLRWAARENLKRARLHRWPADLDRVRALLGA
jgi:hypothetical protein